MAVRITSTELLEIIPDTSFAVLTPFITAASLQVDALALSGCGDALVAAELKEIERWLAAHLVAVSDPKLAKESEKFEDYSVKFSRGKAMSGILSTQFGQMANMMSGGCLAELDKAPAGMFAIGTHGDE